MLAKGHNYFDFFFLGGGRVGWGGGEVGSQSNRDFAISKPYTRPTGKIRPQTTKKLDEFTQ